MAALDGIRIVDLGHSVAGPLAARLLAEQGAEVVRIDRPGDVDRPADAALHLGKRRITLDLHTEQDRATARRLIAASDVLIENFRPGVLARLGLAPDELLTESPRLVICSLPGFSMHDPRAAVPGWEGVIAAATGNCRVRVGEAPADWDLRRPTFTAVPLASNFAAILGATSIVAALIRRERSGRGARIEVPLFDATFELISGAGAYVVDRGFRIEDPLAANGSGTYECADGRYVQFNPIGATRRFLTWFLDAAGRQDWIAEGLDRPPAPDDVDFSRRLRERLTELFLSRPAADWEAIGIERRIPLALVRTTSEWARTEHARSSAQVVETLDPEWGPLLVAGPPVRTAGEPARALSPRHVRDADRAELLAELDARPASVPTPIASGANHDEGDALAGIRVLDLTQILAGPSAGRILAEYGAGVVKVNSPQRRIEAHGVVNRGKKSILVDLQRTEGQELLWQLIDRADVVTQNFPQGTAERYGIGARHIHARRPDVVYVSVSCYGYDGPWAGGRGYEVQGQAVTGIMERTGRGGRPGVLGPYNPLDYGTGAMASFAAMVGLYVRSRTGEGIHVWTSLAQTATFHQATLLLEPAPGASLPPSDQPTEPAGREALGASALQRFYQAEDEWLFLGAGDAQLGAVAAATGIPASDARDAVDPHGSFATALSARIRTRPADHWIAELRLRGVGAHRVVRLPELLDEPFVRDTGLSVRQHTDEAGEVVAPGPSAWVDGARLAPVAAASTPGSDAFEILQTIGREDELALLESRWVVQTQNVTSGWPE